MIYLVHSSNFDYFCEPDKLINMPRVKKEKIDFRTLASHEEYPFMIDGITKKIYTLKSDEEKWVNVDTGQLSVMKNYDRTKEVDHDSLPYTKLFRPSTDKILKNLSVPGSNMFYMIAARIDINSKHICINEEDFAAHCGYSKLSKRLYYQAVGELCHKSIIKRKAGFSRCYWVNANIIFNGDRTKI